ncbi:hypothetical protein LINPERPRIM_LOCUS20655, partial [Linum perenne]
MGREASYVPRSVCPLGKSVVLWIMGCTGGIYSTPVVVAKVESWPL